MWWLRSNAGWSNKPPKAAESVTVHLISPLLVPNKQVVSGGTQAATFREGFLVAMTGTIRHEAARRSLLFDRRLQVREPASPPRLS